MRRSMGRSSRCGSSTEGSSAGVSEHCSSDAGSDCHIQNNRILRIIALPSFRSLRGAAGASVMMATLIPAIHAFAWCLLVGGGGAVSPEKQPFHLSVSLPSLLSHGWRPNAWLRENVVDGRLAGGASLASCDRMRCRAPQSQRARALKPRSKLRPRTMPFNFVTNRLQHVHTSRCRQS